MGERLFERVGAHLQAKGLRLSTGTIVDATIINAPSSTKNARQERDPEMHQTRKGKPWYFGMKAHVGVDSQTKLIHSVVATAANAADSTMLLHLLHGAETRVWGDQAYRGQSEVPREHAPHAQDFTHQRYRYKDHIDEIEREKNRTKSKVRSNGQVEFAPDTKADSSCRQGIVFLCFRLSLCESRSVSNRGDEFLSFRQTVAHMIGPG